MITQISVGPEKSLRLALFPNLMNFTGVFLVRQEVAGISSVLFLEKFFY